MNHWTIWQIVDSAFPGGGFAHSGGLEAAVQAGWVRDAESLGEFVSACLRQQRRGALSVVAAVHQSLKRLDEIDRAWDLQLNNHVANCASRAQGHALVLAAGRIWGGEEILNLGRQVRAKELAGHFASLFGAVMRGVGVDQEEAASAFLFLTARGIVSSAVRLGIVGPLEGQKVQVGLMRDPLDMGEVELFSIRRSQHGPEAHVTLEGLVLPERPLVMVQTSPILDLIQGTQDRLYSRLFQS